MSLLRKFLSGNERTVMLKKNVMGMILMKGGVILIGLLLVPLTIDYVDSEQYGIWMVVVSMVGWMSFFDIGINNGLKNKLASAISNNDFILGKKYVSTAYLLLCIIFIPLMIILVIIANYIDWATIMNIKVDNNILRGIMQIMIANFCISSILSTINVILTADQRPADAALRSFIQQALMLVILYILTFTVKGSLLVLCICYTIVPIIVLLLFNITLFKSRYKSISPSIHMTDVKLIPELMKLGVKFFIIQIAAVIQYQMINFIIIRYYGATDVTNYNVAYRLFSVLTMGWGILTTPLWSAVTNAIELNEKEWIKRACIKYLKLLVLISAGGMVVLLLSPYIYKIWVGDNVSISFTLSLWVMVYNLVICFGGLFVNILNGASILKIQTISSIVSPIIFITLCSIFIYSGCGIYSIIIAAILSNFNGYLFAPIQVYYFLKDKNKIVPVSKCVSAQK